MDYSKHDDETLVNLVAQARTGALDELFERYHRYVFSVAIHIVGDQATAEEITLDTFESLWRKANTYRIEQAKVSTWLVSITRNRAIDILRRRRRRPEQAAIDLQEIKISINRSSGVDEHRENPEVAVHLALRERRIQVALEQLPDGQRQAILLAYFRGYTHSEIAEVLDLPLGTVKSRIRMAIQKLRQLLKDEEPFFQ